jgi:hypothetical protein
MVPVSVHTPGDEIATTSNDVAEMMLLLDTVNDNGGLWFSGDTSWLGPSN